jgi:RHS repeat-associated protein
VVREYVYFGGRMVARSNGAAGLESFKTDRLHSNQDAPGGGFFPFGETKSGAATTGESFATYSRDWHGLDYADQRWYAATVGRFTTSDPFVRSANLNDSTSWNQFSYSRGDTVNRIDPMGLKDEPAEDIFRITVTELLKEAGLVSTGSGGGGRGDPPSSMDEESPSESGPDQDPVYVESWEESGGFKFNYYSNDDQIATIFKQFFVGLTAALRLPGEDASKCSNWLGSGMLAQEKINIHQFAPSLIHGVGYAMNIGAISGQPSNTIINAVSGGPRYGTITINLEGAGFSRHVPVGNGVTGITAGTQRALAQIFLHELAHLAGTFGFLADAGNSDQVKKNNELLLSNCRGVLNGYRNTH